MQCSCQSVHPHSGRREEIDFWKSREEFSFSHRVDELSKSGLVRTRAAHQLADSSKPVAGHYRINIHFFVVAFLCCDYYKLPMQVIQVDALRGLEPQEFRVKYCNSPLLIKDGLSLFPKVQAWTADMISRKYPNVSCRYANDSRPVRSKMTTTYRDFFTTKADAFYTFTRTKYTGNDDMFIQNFQFPNPLFEERDIDKHIFFCGPRDTGALPHEHGAALNFLVSGEKRWVMFDAKTPKGTRTQQYYYRKYPASHLSLEWFDQEYDSLLTDPDISVQECVQKGNDVVYIPGGFSHTTLNHTAVLGIVIELK